MNPHFDAPASFFLIGDYNGPNKIQPEKYPIQCKSLQSRINGLHMSILGMLHYFLHDPLYALMRTIKTKELDFEMSTHANDSQTYNLQTGNLQ